MHGCKNTFRLGYGATGRRIGKMAGGVRNCLDGHPSRKDYDGMQFMRRRFGVGYDRIWDPRFREVHFNVIRGPMHPEFEAFSETSGRRPRHVAVWILCVIWE